MSREMGSKIVQIVGGTDAEGNVVVVGLDSYGRLWDWVCAQSPYLSVRDGKKEYVAGHTEGWRRRSDWQSLPVPHPDAPGEEES